MLKFGTSGLRGPVTDLLSGASGAYAKAFGTHLLQSGFASPGAMVFLGQDRRESSPAIARDCAAGLAAVGLVPVDCGALPTPALACHAMAKGAACLMVTGSHIPADQNGLKFYRPDGEIEKSDEAAIAAAVADVAPLSATQADAMESDGGAALDAYRARYAGLFAPGFLEGKRIGIYEHSSVARDLLADLLADTGASVLRLGRVDGFVAVDTEAIAPETIARFGRWCAEHSLDAILSTDGDADRPFVADETGRQVRGDVLGLLTARRLGAGTVVTPVTSNTGITEALGFDVVRTRVGSPFVIEGMARAARTGRHPVVGFEANGGFLTATPVEIGGRTLSPLPTRDCVLPMLCVLSAMAEAGTSLSALVASLALPVAASGRIEHFAREDSARLMAHLTAAPANVTAFAEGLGTVQKVADIDGVQIFLDGGSVLHVRPSGNAPEMRCYGEAARAEAAQALVDAGLERIRAFAAATPA